MSILFFLVLLYLDGTPLYSGEMEYLSQLIGDLTSGKEEVSQILIANMDIKTIADVADINKCEIPLDDPRMAEANEWMRRDQIFFKSFEEIFSGTLSRKEGADYVASILAERLKSYDEFEFFSSGAEEDQSISAILQLGNIGLQVAHIQERIKLHESLIVGVKGEEGKDTNSLKLNDYFKYAYNDWLACLQDQKKCGSRWEEWFSSSPLARGHGLLLPPLSKNLSLTVRNDGGITRENVHYLVPGGPLIDNEFNKKMLEIIFVYGGENFDIVKFINEGESYLSAETRSEGVINSPGKIILGLMILKANQRVIDYFKYQKCLMTRFQGPVLLKTAQSYLSLESSGAPTSAAVFLGRESKNSLAEVVGNKIFSRCENVQECSKGYVLLGDGIYVNVEEIARSQQREKIISMERSINNGASQMMRTEVPGQKHALAMEASKPADVSPLAAAAVDDSGAQNNNVSTAAGDLASANPSQNQKRNLTTEIESKQNSQAIFYRERGATCDVDGTIYYEGDVRCFGNVQKRCQQSRMVTISECSSREVCYNRPQYKGNNLFTSCKNRETIEQGNQIGREFENLYKGTFNLVTGEYDNWVFSSCSPLAHLENGVCVSNRRTCEMGNGEGLSKFDTTSASWGPCVLQRCKDSRSFAFRSATNSCIALTRSCSLPASSHAKEGRQELERDDQYGACFPISCQFGYQKKDQQCLAVENTSTITSAAASLKNSALSIYLTFANNFKHSTKAATRCEFSVKVDGGENFRFTMKDLPSGGSREQLTNSHDFKTSGEVSMECYHGNWPVYTQKLGY